jgi:hypothetical protein
MATLGDFGEAHEPNTETFGWFGAELRVHPDLSNLVFVETLGRPFRTFGESMESLRDLVGMLVHPEDVDEFWQLARANRQTQDDVLRVGLEIVGALTRRPTARPSDSSAGPPATDTGSTGSSSSQAALRLLDKRPDLQVAVLRAERELAAL